jgi:Transglutaminase-like superfamily
MVLAVCSYFLSKHVHICTVDDQIVVLDLLSGKYLSLDAEDAGSLGISVVGWPFSSRGTENPKLLHRLLARGFLTMDPQLGKPPESTSAPDPRASMWDRALSAPPKIRAHHVLEVTAAITLTRMRMRFMKFSRIIDRISRRKGRHDTYASEPDLDRACECQAIFETLRPLVYKKTGACLLTALSLVEFLAQYGIFPDLIFAVKVNPFRAHCYVQYRGFVMLDYASQAETYNPIMVV